MSLEERLIDRDILQRPDALALVDFKNPIHQQKWIAMRQLFENFVDIHHAWYDSIFIFWPFFQGPDPVAQTVQLLQ